MCKSNPFAISSFVLGRSEQRGVRQSETVYIEIVSARSVVTEFQNVQGSCNPAELPLPNRYSFDL
jgi:hypothetical protein